MASGSVNVEAVLFTEAFLAVLAWWTVIMRRELRLSASREPMRRATGCALFAMCTCIGASLLPVFLGVSREAAWGVAFVCAFGMVLSLRFEPLETTLWRRRRVRQVVVFGLICTAGLIPLITPTIWAIPILFAILVHHRHLRTSAATVGQSLQDLALLTQKIIRLEGEKQLFAQVLKRGEWPGGCQIESDKVVSMRQNAGSGGEVPDLLKPAS